MRQCIPLQRPIHLSILRQDDIKSLRPGGCTMGASRRRRRGCYLVACGYLGVSSRMMDRQKSLNRSRSSGEAKEVVAAHLIGRRCSPMLHPKLLRHLPHLPPSHTLCCCCCCCAACVSLVSFGFSRLLLLPPIPCFFYSRSIPLVRLSEASHRFLNTNLPLYIRLHLFVLKDKQQQTPSPRPNPVKSPPTFLGTIR